MASGASLSTLEPAPVVVMPDGQGASSFPGQRFRPSSGTAGMLVFGVALLAGTVYAASHLIRDLSGVHLLSAWPYVLLGVALAIALGFEFVNGFHDTANAVATVIYTNSLEPHFAVVWSGLWNLIGVLTSSGAVAFAIMSLLPVELILQVGKGAGFAMVFSLLIAAIVWNLSTWWFGLPASSSHTLIGSIIGVGVANQFLRVHSGTGGIDWEQARNVFKVLLISPIIGFGCSALLLLALKFVLRKPELYESPKGNQPPPLWIRALLIVTCTGVSFGHGSNDGQKGMGLIMLILIGTVPPAYALNHAIGIDQMHSFIAVSQQAEQALDRTIARSTAAQTHSADPRGELTACIRTRHLTPAALPALRQMIDEIDQEVVLYKSLSSVPASQQQNVRNDMYVVSESLRLLAKKGEPPIAAADAAVLASYKGQLDCSTKYIPSWVKVAVALALGLGTMVGWKRVVVTVGERIGKEHLTYAQGAAAQIVAACTILAADSFHMPVSTTHVLSSGVAGTMSANGSGLRMATVRNIALAWIFTLPAAALLAGGIFLVMSRFV